MIRFMPMPIRRIVFVILLIPVFCFAIFGRLLCVPVIWISYICLAAFRWIMRGVQTSDKEIEKSVYYVKEWFIKNDCVFSIRLDYERPEFDLMERLENYLLHR